jgi:hypothetical protein
MTTEEAAEIQELAIEREAAERDLKETLGAIEDRLSPVPAVRRFVAGQSPARALTGMAAAGVALGLISDERPALQVTGLAAAALAGVLLLRHPR